MLKQKKLKCKRKLKRHITGDDYTNVWAEECTDLYKDKKTSRIDMVCFVQSIYAASEI